MSQQGLEQFGAYQKARRVFALVVEDMEHLKGNTLCFRLVAQQVGSADSICANIEEGYGRLSRAEYIRFLDIARGSARETRGRYERMKAWLPVELVKNRTDLLDEIIANPDELHQDNEEQMMSPRYSMPYSGLLSLDTPQPVVLPLDPRPSTLDT